MNTLPTYNEQFNKITEAYIKGEIKPYNQHFCFCGTIGLNPDKGLYKLTWDINKYSWDNYRKMEDALLITITAETVGLDVCDKYGAYHEADVKDKCNIGRPLIESHPNYETALFNGMVAALEVLKQIHIERGETIDAPPVFIQRPIIEPCK